MTTPPELRARPKRLRLLIAALAATAAVSTALDRAASSNQKRMKRTMVDIRSNGTAIASYMVDNGVIRAALSTPAPARAPTSR